MTGYEFMAIAFTVSGVFHLLSDISQGIPMSESGAMQFFYMQTLGIMIEDAIQAIFKKLPSETVVPLRIVAKATGYLW